MDFDSGCKCLWRFVYASVTTEIVFNDGITVSQRFEWTALNSITHIDPVHLSAGFCTVQFFLRNVYRIYSRKICSKIFQHFFFINK